MRVERSNKYSCLPITVSVVANPAICATITNVGVLCDSENNSASCSSHEDSDDFVLVSKDLPEDQRLGQAAAPPPVRQQTQQQPTQNQSSPPRPSSLPISEPKPVPAPARRHLANAGAGVGSPGRQGGIPLTVATLAAGGHQIPRSQPISVKQPRADHRKSSVSSDINSISPPAVQFAIGTPPTRVRSASGGSLSETPPPHAPSTWQVSPGHSQSPLRRSGNSSPVLPSAALSKLPTLGSPTLMVAPGSLGSIGSAGSGSENNNHHMLGPRAFTLPELGATGGLQSLLDTAVGAGGPGSEPIAFQAPELSEETLMDREHNETLSKLNFVLALTDCIQEVADSRCAPLSTLMVAGSQTAAEQHQIPPHAPEHCKRAERLVLLVRALQLLSSGLNLATQQLRNGQLKPSSNVRNGKLDKQLSTWIMLSTLHHSSCPAVYAMNAKYRSILFESKRLNGSGLLQKANAFNITADKILYDYALDMVSKAKSLNRIICNSYLFYSARRQHWMSFLRIPRTASNAITQHTFCCTHWSRSAPIHRTKCC